MYRSLYEGRLKGFTLHLRLTERGMSLRHDVEAAHKRKKSKWRFFFVSHGFFVLFFTSLSLDRKNPLNGEKETKTPFRCSATIGTKKGKGVGGGDGRGGERLKRIVGLNAEETTLQPREKRKQRRQKK